MKKLFYFLRISVIPSFLFLITTTKSNGQNLISNPSFEFPSLPNNTWRQWTSCWDEGKVKNPPVRYHCGFNLNDTVSNNNGFPLYNAFHTPRTGKIKAIIQQTIAQQDDLSDSVSDVRSYLQIKLKSPLVSGEKYTFKMYVSSGLGKDQVCGRITTAAKNLGVIFSTGKIITDPNAKRYIAEPQINFNGINFFTTLTDWTELTSIYTATGGEEYIAIGNFSYYKDIVFEKIVGSQCPDDVNELWALLSIDDVSLVRLGGTDNKPKFLDIGNDTIICDTTNINMVLKAQGGFSSYEWNTGSTDSFITITKPGKYWCKVYADCDYNTDTINILPEPELPIHSVNLGNDTNVCDTENMNIPLQVPELFNRYVWNTGDTSSSLLITKPGVYSVKAFSDCQILHDTIEIKLFNKTPYNISLGNDTVVCDTTNLSLRLEANHFENYIWSTGNADSFIEVKNTGLYWLTAQYYCGTISDSIKIEFFKDKKTLKVTNDTIKCDDGIPIIIKANSGFDSYKWNTGETTENIKVNASGKYIIQAQDYCGPQFDTVEIEIIPIPNVPAVKDSIICQYSPVFYFNADGQNILWYNSISDTSGSNKIPFVQTDSAIIFKCYATQTINGCESPKASVQLKITEKPYVNLGNDTSFCDEKEIQLKPYYNPDWFYTWEDFNHSPAKIINETGLYILTVSNSCGISSDSIYIEIYNCLFIIPNAFTPNGDGLNDFFSSVFEGAKIKNMQIANRWGTILYESNFQNPLWDGNYKGSPVPEGIYIYMISYLNPKGQIVNTKNTVLVLR